MIRRLVLLALTGLLAAGAASADGKMTMVSWGGAYGRATQKALLDPFARSVHFDVLMEDFNGGLAEIRAQVETGNVHWDVVDLEAPDAVRGCDEGLLEALPLEEIFPDAAAAEQDFLAGTLSECGIGLIVYSTIYAYRSDLFSGAGPATMADFFDLETVSRPPRHAPLAVRQPGVRAGGRRRAGGPGVRRPQHPLRGWSGRSASWTRSRTRWCGGRPARSRRSSWPTARW